MGGVAWKRGRRPRRAAAGRFHPKKNLRISSSDFFGISGLWEHWTRRRAAGPAERKFRRASVTGEAAALSGPRPAPRPKSAPRRGPGLARSTCESGHSYL